MPFKYGGVTKDELTGYERFPEGEYDFFIESIIETARNGDPILEMVLKPTDYNMQKYGKVWHRINLDNEWTQINVGRFLVAIGVDPEQPGDIFFSHYCGEHLSARIKHNARGEKVFVNAYLLPREKKTEQTHEHAPPRNLANEWDGESGRDDDIPF